MDYGYFTMPLHPPGSNITETLDEDLEQIVVLDNLGFREAWIGEHFTSSWENIPAPDLLIAEAIPLIKNIMLVLGVPGVPNDGGRFLLDAVGPKSILAHGRFY